MQSTENTNPREPLGEALARLLRTESASGLRIREITAAVGEKGFGLLFVVLALPSALPIPAPGYSTPFGIVISLIALQMIFSRRTVWLPERLGRIRIKPSMAHTMLGSASGFLKKIEHFIRPRQLWISGRAGRIGMGLVVLCMACLMIFPIPLTNTAPAMVIFLLGVGLSEEDGLLALFALALGCFALTLYVGILYLLIQEGPGAIDAIKQSIKSLLGLEG